MERYDAGLKVIASAQQSRDAGNFTEAHAQFVKGIEELMRLVQSEQNEATKNLVRKHVTRFMDDAEKMVAAQKLCDTAVEQAVSRETNMLRAKAQGVETRARNAESSLKFALAFNSYAEAAEKYKNLRQETKGNASLHAWAGERAVAMLDGAERMSRFVRASSSAAASAAADEQLNLFDLPHVPGVAGAAEAAGVPVNFAKPDAHVASALPNSLTETFVRGRSSKDAAQEQVLIAGNKINGRIFERMHAADADWINFEGADFKDPDGQPRLSKKQKEKGAVWARPIRIFGSPTLIKHFTYESITQTLVGDCSFVSSLAVCAAWERRFGRTLISRNIFPQRNGVPVLSPSGKYIVKMYLNGSVRKIIIDDYLPVVQASASTLLCSFSSAADELWVSLFEKAYIKLHNGYDFPGSTSSIDLHALCGWIPETFHLSADSTSSVSREEAWQRLKLGQDKGSALFTLGTRAMSNEEEDRTGLASQHAYAVLAVEEACGRRLLKVKNPWCHMRWKGEFAPEDDKNWTAELKEAMKYDQADAREVDNGIFWISWEAVLNFYSAIHCSWSPARFAVRQSVHGYWKKTASDREHLDDSPQYVLRVTASRDTMVWLLLDRHYVDTKAQPHIALHVYAGGRKVYYPSGALEHSVYRNSPHFLLRLKCNKGDNAFVLVVSMYDDAGVLPYTLSTYSAEPAALYKALDCPAIEAQRGFFHHTFRYAWSTETAGGSLNTESFDRNPMFRLESTRAQRLFIKVRPVAGGAEGSGSVGSDGTPYVAVHLWQSGARVRRRVDGDKEMTKVKKAAGTKEYRALVTSAEYDLMQGQYTLVVATFRAGYVGEFDVTVKAEATIKIASLPPAPPTSSTSDDAVAPAPATSPPTPSPPAPDAPEAPSDAPSVPPVQP